MTTATGLDAFHLSAVDLTVAEVSCCDASRRLRRLAAARQCAELADLAYHQTRAAISGPHSMVLDDLGLGGALESLVQSAQAGVGPRSTSWSTPRRSSRPCPRQRPQRLPDRPGLANAVRHSQADRVVLSLRRVGDSVVLGCADDGVGFDPPPGAQRAGDDGGAQHFGLSSIAERCALVEASLRLESAPGRGRPCSWSCRCSQVPSSARQGSQRARALARTRCERSARRRLSDHVELTRWTRVSSVIGPAWPPARSASRSVSPDAATSSSVTAEKGSTSSASTSRTTPAVR
ncbi:MAG: hypothetical protein R2734_17495 [Nocardioides sp.]